MILVSMEREEAGNTWAPRGRDHMGGRHFAVISKYLSVFEKCITVSALFGTVSCHTNLQVARFLMVIFFYQGEYFSLV